MRDVGRVLQLPYNQVDSIAKMIPYNPANPISLNDAIKEMKDLLIEGRIKDTFINRYSNYLYLKPYLKEHNSPLGKEIKINI